MNLRGSKRLTAIVVTVAAIVLVACGDDDEVTNTNPAPSDDATVTVKAFDFRPDPIVVPAGTTITFINEDAIDHTVTAGTRENPTPQVFDGQLPERDATFELTLDKPGTYEYFCEIHPGPGMTATIKVESS